MTGTIDILRQLPKEHAFLVGIDSDGCVFDSMEIKHKECFVPQFVRHFGLQAVSRYARECWEFVNLYSRTRGINRFPALSCALNLLGERPEVRARGVEAPSTDALDEWISRETRLGNAALQAEVEGGNKALAGILEWSLDVNRAIESMVHGVPPFPLVREVLDRLAGAADAIVVSQTPVEALQREWSEHGLDGRVKAIAGQEMGTKREHLQAAMAGRYSGIEVLMIGDAPGDRKAALSNGALFYPVVPGAEEASWRRLHDESLQVFLEGGYAGAYQDALAAEFDASLPEAPPWQA